MDFAERHSKLFPNTKSFCVSGEKSTSFRNLVLNDFKKADRAIVSNSRCLTEGVDVPAIDLVYFCDPKNSKVDIVQAVGRALRKKKNNREAGLSESIGDFFLTFFLPLGIWFLQPRTNKIVESQDNFNETE